MRGTRLLLLTALMLFAGVSPLTAAWQWNARQLQAIKVLQRQVTADEDGTFRLESPSWVLETGVDRRFTAELALFMDLFSASVGPVLPGTPQTAQKPTVRIFKDRKGGSSILDFPERSKFVSSTE